jgi:hypothetical protein
LVSQPKYVTEKRMELQERLQKIDEALDLAQALKLA